MEKRRVTQAAVLAFIKENQPCSVLEITKAFDVQRSICSSKVIKLHKNKKIYVSSWRRDNDGKIAYIKPLYCVGSLRDAQKNIAPLTQAERQRRYFDSKKHRVSSVFVFAIPAKHRTRNRLKDFHNVKAE